MSNVLMTEIVDHIEILPSNLQNHVLTIVRTLSRPFRNDRYQANIKVNSVNIENQLQETAGQRVAKLAGTISPSDLDLMSHAIAEGCERIDIDEW